MRIFALKVRRWQRNSYVKQDRSSNLLDEQMKGKQNRFFIGIIAMIILIAMMFLVIFISRPSEKPEPPERFQVFNEVQYPTPNYDSTRTNEILGVVLHHTAEPTVESALSILSSPEKKVGTHVVIDTDGTRYVMAEPSVVAYHAGSSVLNGRDSCNNFTIGIEFQGNTLVSPLTEEQIASGIEYLLPLIEKNKIPLGNIVTHEMVRTAYMKKYPEKRCSGKVDITPTEYHRFMDSLHKVCEAELEIWPSK